MGRILDNGQFMMTTGHLNEWSSLLKTQFNTRYLHLGQNVQNLCLEQ